MESFTAGELAELVAGTVEGNPGRRVSRIAPVGEAGPEDLTFVTGPRYGALLARSRPGAALVPPDLPAAGEETTLIRVADPQIAFSRLAPLFHPSPPASSGVASTAVLGRGVLLGEGVAIGPYVVVGDRVQIGDRSVLGPHTVVEREVRIGEDCHICAGCTLMWGVRIGDRVRLHPGVRVGTDGFGYATRAAGHAKVPQIGGCVVGDDVEIGANSTVDRGSIGDTWIGAGSKIDNLVHIGHNVRVGERCLIVAQVGIAGSVTVGEDAQIGGQAGISGHLTVGARARIAAQAGVIGDVPPGATYSGYPARPHRPALRASAALLRLPEALRRLRRLEERIFGESRK